MSTDHIPETSKEDAFTAQYNSPPLIKSIRLAKPSRFFSCTARLAVNYLKSNDTNRGQSGDLFIYPELQNAPFPSCLGLAFG